MLQFPSVVNVAKILTANVPALWTPWVRCVEGWWDSPKLLVVESFSLKTPKLRSFTILFNLGLKKIKLVLYATVANI